MNRTNGSILLLYLVVFGLCGFLLYRVLHRETAIDEPDAQPRLVTARGDLAEDEKATIELFKVASPSVVNVQSAAVLSDPYSRNIQRIRRGTGTGFVWDDKGHIVTNYHVVQGSREVKVTLADQSTWKAYAYRYDEQKDIAVLWTDAPLSRLRPLPIGESSKLQVGQKTYAIGNPFGLDHTLTTGIVSALNREIEAESGRNVKGVIQTDAAINPGNSGGPLLDSAGRLIGVNTAIISPSGTSAGIGFAIPVDEVNRVVPRLLRGEKAVTPSLGIEEFPDSVARDMGVEGVIIARVDPDGPAEKAGLRGTKQAGAKIRWGHIITALDDHPIKSVDDLSSLLEKSYRVGQEVTVTYQRNEEEKKTKLTLTAESR
jgi:S1-C subfamily serine protease